MTIHNHNHSNRNYDRVPKSARHLYTAPLCVECGGYVLPYRDGSNLCHCAKCGDNVPFVSVLETEVVKYRDGLKETATRKTAQFMDELGTHMIISGGEVLELDSHLESCYEERTEKDMPF